MPKIVGTACTAVRRKVLPMRVRSDISPQPSRSMSKTAARTGGAGVFPLHKLMLTSFIVFVKRVLVNASCEVAFGGFGFQFLPNPSVKLDVHTLGGARLGKLALPERAGAALQAIVNSHSRCDSLKVIETRARSEIESCDGVDPALLTLQLSMRRCATLFRRLFRGA